MDKILEFLEKLVKATNMSEKYLELLQGKDLFCSTETIVNYLKTTCYKTTISIPRDNILLKEKFPNLTHVSLYRFPKEVKGDLTKVDNLIKVTWFFFEKGEGTINHLLSKKTLIAINLLSKSHMFYKSQKDKETSSKRSVMSLRLDMLNTENKPDESFIKDLEDQLVLVINSWYDKIKRKDKRCPAS